MRISRLTIVGMHKVVHQSYDFNDLTYIIGQNGAGKSTVMQAIQLALLGYIPGTDKNKSAIFRHSNSNLMSVYLQFDDNTSILRQWQDNGKDIKVTTQFMPYEFNLEDIISELELPIFNFNEFVSMTANKLKDWFINYLPECEVDIDLASELRSAAPFADTISDTLIDDTVKTIESFDGKQIDKVRKFNELCKQKVSQYKVESTRLTDTMQSLVYYDDYAGIHAEPVEDDIKAADLKLQVCRSKIAKYSQNASMLKRLSEIKATLGVNNVTEYGAKIDDLSAKIKECGTYISSVQAEITEINNVIDGINRELDSKIKVLGGQGKCPYTNTPCDTIGKIIYNMQADYDAGEAKIAEYKLKLSELNAKKSEYDRDMSVLQSQLAPFNSNGTVFIELLKSVDTSLEDVNINALTAEEANLNAELEMLREKLTKIKANQQYDALKDKILKDSMQASQLLEVYKLWDKLTGVNGLQTKIMVAPFIKFAEEITKYLTKFFTDDKVSAHFYSGEKANSFSFGMMRNGKYIEFDLLSSGEKCLYTLALLMALTENSKSELKLIMVDDLLDHLDSNRIVDCFKTLYSCKDMQIVIAGVQPCTLPEMTNNIIQIS